MSLINGVPVSEWIKMAERMTELAARDELESRQDEGDDDGGSITIEIGVMSAEKLRKVLLGVPIPDSDGDVPELIGREPVPDGTYECGCEWGCNIRYRVWRTYMGTVLTIIGHNGQELSVVLNGADIFQTKGSG